MGRTTRNLIEHVHDLSALVKDRSKVRLPGEFADSLYSRVVLLFNGDQFRVRCDAVFNDPLAQLADAVKFLLELEPLRCLISFVTSRGGMSLRLGHIRDMYQRGDVILARDLSRSRVCFE